MKNRNSSLITLGLLLLLVLMGISACDKDKPTTPAAPTGFVTGTVYAQGRSVLTGVTVKIGTLSTTTNAYGMYMLSGVPVGANIQVGFEKAGLISLQKTVAVEEGKTSNISCTMFGPVSSTTDISSITGGSISDGSAQVVIPANGFLDANNVPFTGTVLSEIKYFDPTTAECLDAFPGNFVGLMADGVTETAFESYGFISAQFFDAANPTTTLKLRPGKIASLISPIPLSLQASAPASMPMWYYDESAGKWKEQGTATKVGTQYEGNVSHFSYWNFDHPIIISDQSTLTGKVVMNDTANTPVSGAQLVATGVNYAGYTRVHTDANGNFTITVKASSQARVRAYIGQNTSPANSAVIDTPVGAGTLAIGNIVVADESYYITGKLVDVAGAAIPQSYGYVMNATTGSQIAPITTDINGNFHAQIFPAKGKAVVSVKFTVNYMNAALSSANLQYTEPQIGQIYTFVTPIQVLDRGYTLTGTLVDTASQPIANGYGSVLLSPSGSDFGSFTTDATGHFSARIENPSGTSPVSVVFRSGWGNNSIYSVVLQYTEPQAAGTYNFSTSITMAAGGAITGIVKDGNGALITNGQIQFMSESGGVNQEIFSEIDANGRFTIKNAPNTVFTGMRAQAYANNNSYRAASTMTLIFPGIGATTDINDLILILQATP